MPLVVVEPPAEPVISWAEAQRHLRLDGDDSEQATVMAMVAAVTDHLGAPMGWLGRSLGPQTLELRLDGFRDLVTLPGGPVIEVVSVQYFDDVGAVQTVAGDVYELRDGAIGAAWGKSWPRPGRYRGQRDDLVRIRYRAGYEPDPDADPPVSAVPPAIKAAMLLMLGDLFNQRETFVTGISASEVPMSTTVSALLTPYRLWY